MDLHRPFCSTDSQILGGVNNYKGHPLNDVACALDFCARDKRSMVKRMDFIVVNIY